MINVVRRGVPTSVNSSSPSAAGAAPSPAGAAGAHAVKIMANSARSVISREARFFDMWFILLLWLDMA